MKRIISLTLIPLLVGFAIGYTLSLSESDKDLLAVREAKADSENAPPSQIVDDEKEEEENTPATAYEIGSIEDIEEFLMSQNGYTYISKEKAVEIFGDKLIQLPEELRHDFETTGKYFADTNLEEGRISVGQYWINAANKKIIMVREFMPSKDTKETFKEHLKLSLDNKGNPLYDYPLKLSEDVYALMWGPCTELLDGSPFEPSWIKSMIHAYWIKDNIGITVSGINIKEDKFTDILIKINSQI